MKKILINDTIWQTRVAITQDGLLQNIYFATHNQENLERSFFKGVVTKVLPGIQTAFVNIGPGFHRRIWREIRPAVCRPYPGR